MPTKFRLTRRPLLHSALLTTAMFAAAFWAPASGVAGGGKPCSTKDFKVTQVAKACSDGGRKAATKLMKDVVKSQNAKGNSITCDSCHTDLDSFGRTDNAVADLKKYLK